MRFDDASPKLGGVVTAPRSDEGMLGELKWVHDMLRSDLAVCRRLAENIGTGASTADVRSTIEGLQTHRPLWHIRVNCLRYCSFVHAHHGLEDAALFPDIRAADPHRMNAVIDRLEAEHRTVSGLLDEVEAATRELDAAEDASQRLMAALIRLSEHLLEHLAFEEEALAPVLRSWTR